MSYRRINIIILAMLTLMSGIATYIAYMTERTGMLFLITMLITFTLGYTCTTYMIRSK